jgi:hypothetical protein
MLLASALQCWRRNKPQSLLFDNRGSLDQFLDLLQRPGASSELPLWTSGTYLTTVARLERRPCSEGMRDAEDVAAPGAITLPSEPDAKERRET